MDSSNQSSQKCCPLCKRYIHLTFHHFIPRKVHRRAHYKKNYTKAQLNEGVHVCKQCHSGVHKAYDEMTLAKKFKTLEKIQTDATLGRHFEWVAKQRVRT